MRTLDILALSALFGIAHIGAFKGLPFLDSAPIDLTLVFAALAVFALPAVRIYRRQTSDLALVALIGLWLSFLLGTCMLIGYASVPEKAWHLWTIVPVTAALTVSLSWGSKQRCVWVGATLVMGVLALPLMVMFPDVEYQEAFGRLNVSGVSSIGFSRVIGVASLTAAICAAVLAKWRICLLLFSGVGFLVLALIGNRGAFLSALLAATLTILISRRFKDRRLVAGLLGATLASIGFYLLRSSGSRGAARILGMFDDGVDDQARSTLYESAIDLGTQHPFGVGWGRFGAAHNQDPAGAETPLHPHNILFEIFAEGGWIALVAFLLAALLALIGYIRQSYDPMAPVLLSQYLFWFLAAQTSGDIAGNRALWVLLAVGLVFWQRSQARIRSGVGATTNEPRRFYVAEKSSPGRSPSP